MPSPSQTSSSTLPVMPSATLSPPPTADGNKEASGSPSTMADPPASTMPESSKRRYNLTPTEQQALHLQKLLAKPDREVRIPKPLREKELRAPREMIKNVSGSSAGAGSGEFHVYKHSRRREYERIKLMEDKDKKEKEKQEYEEKQREMQEQVDAKTSKNRAKREKKKNAKLAAKGGTAGPVEGMTLQKRSTEEGLEEGGDNERQGKRKRINAEGTAQIVFRRKEDQSDEEDD